MATAQVLCFACNRKFSPHGLSQHVSKTQDLCCRSSSTAAQFPFASSAIPHAGFSLAPGPNYSSARSVGIRLNDSDGRDDETSIAPLNSEFVAAAEHDER